MKKCIGVLSTGIDSCDKCGGSGVGCDWCHGTGIREYHVCHGKGDMIAGRQYTYWVSYGKRQYDSFDSHKSNCST